MALLGTVVGFSLMAPFSATAQSSQAQEMRASAFILVDSDGTVLGRMSRSAFSGVGLLELYDAVGTRRMTITGTGSVNAFDQDGTTIRFRAGRDFASGPRGEPPVNGVQLG